MLRGYLIVLVSGNTIDVKISPSDEQALNESMVRWIINANGGAVDMESISKDNVSQYGATRMITENAGIKRIIFLAWSERIRISGRKYVNVCCCIFILMLDSLLFSLDSSSSIGTSQRSTIDIYGANGNESISDAEIVSLDWLLDTLTQQIIPLDESKYIL